WRQADKLVRSHLLPRWANLDAASIKRADVKALMREIDAPVMANQVLAAASAIFSFAIKEEIVLANPCKLGARNATVSRERVLSESELPLFWKALDESEDRVAALALRTILLTGQRPGEVRKMRLEHLEDGWWTMPGKPEASTRWPGTKNGESH